MSRSRLAMTNEALATALAAADDGTKRAVGVSMVEWINQLAQVGEVEAALVQLRAGKVANQAVRAELRRLAYAADKLGTDADDAGDEQAGEVYFHRARALFAAFFAASEDVEEASQEPAYEAFTIDPEHTERAVRSRLKP
ncbi:hypothetical protein [Fodinicola acaciae]|uniref:hypothetical protein n=1 Tax=Fodinicola acaciae TaxID=2681555 RepID=UPI0013D17E1C|nr:hypothetical protein [Fodinicola acaciae]